jgi:hypothetical protein
VTRPGGTVALCMWDIAGGGMTMLRAFWDAAKQVDPAVTGENLRAGVAEGDIAERLVRAGLEAVEDGSLVARADYDDFDDLWEPFTLAVGPSGSYLASVGDEQREAVRGEFRRQLDEPEGPFSLDARAWFARGRVPG